MSLNLTVVGDDELSEQKWATELANAISEMHDVSVQHGMSSVTHAQIVFVDSSSNQLEGILKGIDRRSRALFLIVQENAAVPNALLQGAVDDVLVAPFRPLEVLSKINHYRNILMWDEVARLNSSFSELLDGLHEDLKLAERLQKAKLPIRFSDVKGFNVSSRYLAGIRSGGDYFDLAESQDGKRLSILMSDSSSYGLSSAVLSVLMKVAMKLTREEVKSSYEIVRRIHDEILMTLSEKDKLSLFYGVFYHSDSSLRYLNLGSSSAFHSSGESSFCELPAQFPAISRTNHFPISNGEAIITIGPDDRLVLVSDGYVDSVGGVKEMCLLLDKFRRAPAVDALNELVYKVKSKFQTDDDMPEQDCSAIILDARLKIVSIGKRT